jgi:hypothetical protein
MAARFTLSCVLVLLLATLASAMPGDASSDTDLGWISQLPGFSEKSKPGETAYLVSGDGAKAWEALSKGLTERGWSITGGSAKALSALSAQRMTAVKANVEASFHLKQAAVLQKLVVSRRTLAEDAAEPR